MPTEYTKEELPEIGSLSSQDMPKDLIKKMKNLTQLQINYAYFRARGFSQVESLQRAGSNSKNRKNLIKMAYLTEKKPEVVDLMNYLRLQSAVKQFVDRDEVINMLRNNYNAAFAEGKYSAANKSAELIGSTINMFKPEKAVEDQLTPKRETKNNIDSFKDDIDSEEDRENKLKKLRSLMGEVSSLKVNNNNSKK